MRNDQDVKQIGQRISSIADEILARLRAHSNNELAIPALAIAMCRQAQADGYPFAKLKKIIELSEQQVRILGR